MIDSHPPHAPPPDASPWVRTREPLIWFGGAGRERRGPTYRYDARARTDSPHVVIQLTLGGTGFYEGRRRDRTLLPPGTAFVDVIPGPFAYGYAPGGDGPYDLVFVSTTGPTAMRWGRRVVGAFGNVMRFDTGSAPADAGPAPLMLEIVRRMNDATLGDRYATSGLLYQLFMSVFSTLSASRVATEPRVSRAVALIADRATDPSFNVLALAGELDCSREYLSRRFTVATGVGPADYLAQHRLRLAAGALRTTPNKLEAVARASGFRTANYLCRVFKKHVGVTPAEYRARPWMAMP